MILLNKLISKLANRTHCVFTKKNTQAQTFKNILLMCIISGITFYYGAISIYCMKNTSTNPITEAEIEYLRNIYSMSYTPAGMEFADLSMEQLTYGMEQEKIGHEHQQKYDQEKLIGSKEIVDSRKHLLFQYRTGNKNLFVHDKTYLEYRPLKKYFHY